MLLTAEVETEVRKILTASQDPADVRRRGLAENIRSLPLPARAVSALSTFRDVRNRIVHGHAATDDEVFRAIDSGLTLLGALRSIPRTLNVVRETMVPLYADPGGREQRQGVIGVMLAQVRPDETEAKNVYPTTRTHFQEGQVVAWEWDFARTWGPTWWRHPDLGEIVTAWDSSAEFVGRPIDEL